MRRAVLGTGLAILACGFAFGQASGNLTFEVASVRPAAQGDRGFFRGGPGTPDPSQIVWNMPTLRTLLTVAYEIKDYQLNGPAWLDSEHYDIVAKVPAGATKEQVNVMWQNLLKERFGIVVHHESKEFQVDELVVAKGGVKLKETTIDPHAPPAVETGNSDKNGVPQMNGPGFMKTIQMGPNGLVGYVVARAQPLSQLATILGNQFRHPVVDKTGLTGKYDFNVEFTPEPSEVRLPPGAAPGPPGAEASEPGPNLVAAIEQQLGLRLVATKAMLDVVVVDKAEKVPTEN
jgi:uncharacterized protein (TIGR03435 family)